MTQYENYLKGLNQDLDILESNPMDVFTKSNQGIKKATLVIRELRNQVVAYGFKSPEDEIYFFKHLKPQVFSKLIYYRKLYAIENERPKSTNKLQRQYLVAEIDRLQAFFNKHKEFHHYYRSGDTHLDTHYFLRNHSQAAFHLDTFYMFPDSEFSTNHDGSVSILLAYNLLILYLRKELIKLNRPFKHIQRTKKKHAIPKLSWTGHKIDLVELIYALYASGAINRGAVNINDIADAFETLLETDLGDYYRTYTELRSRKIHRTKFLDKLKTSLDIHMNHLDR